MAELGPPVDETSTNGSTRSKKVAYFYDSDVGNYAYVAGHPMKPHRIRVAHSLIMNYGCYKKMEIYRAKPATKYEMTQFHTDEYVEFLQKVTPDNMDNFSKEQSKYNVGDDCPVFDGLFEFCGISAGGSMEGAARLNRGKCDIAINWAGGLHHAKKSEASGFCYVNDIVLGIIELLRFHKRVLYIDIDVHHGDGVEEAFYTTDRVMTCSFHKYGEYFPGTGELRDIGIGPGKNYAVNFPLRDGITDRTYKNVFEPVIGAVMEYYKPEAVVLQCGGDSLSGDRLGCFNLSMHGHANCVKFVKSFGLPTLVLGGGGYTMRNVARTWAYETGQLVGVEMNPAIPYNDYYEYFGPDYELNVRPSNMDNANSPEYLEKIKNQVIDNLRRTAAPSTQMTDVPRNPMLNGMDSDAEDEADDLDADEHPDVRNTLHRMDKRIERDDEFEESEDEEMDGANGIRSQPGEWRQRNVGILDYENPHAQPDVEIDADGEPHLVARNGTTTVTSLREESVKLAAVHTPDSSRAGTASASSNTSVANGSVEHSVHSSPAHAAADDENDEDMDEMDIDEEPEPEAAAPVETPVIEADAMETSASEPSKTSPPVTAQPSVTPQPEVLLDEGVASPPAPTQKSPDAATLPAPPTEVPAIEEVIKEKVKDEDVEMADSPAAAEAQAPTPDVAPTEAKPAESEAAPAKAATPEKESAKTETEKSA
ncbi:hypothetical protein EJ06DRAFT_526309 [Trichodelitschia bisporula]|uniref:histone deacetylase n=1 Tax=Trichodelitschia bisporula TaxID=703511 RepID=A0A6G1I8B3_9PEZI|nr:hypothetical protein EJ06DRAFT_526309 [Trichodelitschia bisporula]